MLNRRFNIVGIVFTVLVTAGFLWAAWQWFNRYNWPPPLSVEDMQRNEAQAFTHLQQIARAQERYKDVDWDGNGRTTYAQFPAHLWISVNADNEQIPVKLISRELGFAMGPAEAIDGYYFRNFETRESLKTGTIQRLDDEKEWAMACIPAIYQKTGILLFLADSSGQIVVKEARNMPAHYPADPLAEHWTPVTTLQELKEIQATLSYTLHD